MICQDVRLSLGVYVLGALAPDEAAAVWEHLNVCPGCRAEYEELAGLPAMLGCITEAEAAFGPVQADTLMLEKLLDRVSTERRGTSRRLQVLAAAAAIVLVVVAGVTGWSQFSGKQQDKLTTVTALNNATNVKATISYKPASSGTWAKVQLTGVEAGARCKLVAVGKGGEQQVASSWQATYEGEAEVTGEVALPPQQIARFEVVTLEGHELVSVTPKSD
jgi:predicted anti-sigma-YlaC factor YlaD